MVKQNNHMSPQPFMRAKQNLITIRGSPKLINKSSNQEKYEIKQSQFSPKIRTNFKFKPSDRNQKQLRRDLVVSFDRKNDENQDIYENNDDSASAKMKESLSLVMKSSNFNCKFNSKPKQNKLKILSKTKKFISEIASPNLDTILKLCRSKVSSPVSTDKSLIDMYQSGKDIASESTSNTKPSYNSPRNAPMKIKMNKIPRIAWEIRNSNFKPKPNEKSKFTKEEMMNMIKIRRESIIERYLNS